MVNIEELSAKELYELAKKKEQEEARLNQLQEQITGLQGDREQLIKKYEEELAETDRKIEELNTQRRTMTEGHQKALAMLDHKLKTLSEERQAKKASRESETPPQTKEKAPSPDAEVKEPLIQEELPPPSENEVDEPAPRPEKKPKTKGKDEAEELEILLEHLQKMMKGRSYISDSLLREKLRAANFKPANLGKLLDTLVRQAKLVRRSGGNYVLGRVGKKK